MSLFRSRTVVQQRQRPVEERYSFQSWVDDVMKFGGNTYALGNQLVTTYGNKPIERVTGNFIGYTGGAFATDGVVFSVIDKRMKIFSEARFQFRRFQNGRPGDLFGNQDLAILEHPWAGGTTGDMLSRMILDADLAGNSYWARIGGELVRLRPDWVDIVLAPRMAPVGAAGDPVQVGWTREGYFFHQYGQGGGHEPAVFLPDEVCHFAPIPDPLATYRGMSWLTPIIRDIETDKAITEHAVSFLEHGATPNMVITVPRETTKTQFELFKEAYKENHDGANNSHRPLFLTAGADATVVGSNMADLNLKGLRSLSETRIAMAGGIHPVILGTTEGMSGSSLNSGNYTAAKRSTADGTFRPMWRNVAGSLETIVPAPKGCQLWFDDRDVAFLREDQLDLAEIASKDAAIIRMLGDGGWDMESIKSAMKADYDWSMLVPTGLVPVQLQPPGSGQDPPSTPADTTPPE